MIGRRQLITEADWLGGTAPEPMLEYLRGKARDRKLRLFSVACCERVWLSPEDSRCRDAVEVATRMADGLVDDEEIESAEEGIADAWADACAPDQIQCKWTAEASGTLHLTHPDPLVAAVQTGPRSAAFWPDNTWRAAVDANDGPILEPVLESPASRERIAQAALLLCIVGPAPFRPVTLHPSWLTTTVTSLAQAVYDDRQMPSGLFDNQRMGVLADALEEAGCHNADILGHLRGGGEHVRGCWAVDLVLGKE
jgi:hypothetical protein